MPFLFALFFMLVLSCCSLHFSFCIALFALPLFALLFLMHYYSSCNIVPRVLPFPSRYHSSVVASFVLLLSCFFFHVVAFTLFLPCSTFCTAFLALLLLIQCCSSSVVVPFTLPLFRRCFFHVAPFMLLFPCCNFHTILPAFHLLHYFSHIAALALFLSCCSFRDAPYALPLSKMGL